jgi:hypothetical protein
VLHDLSDDAPVLIETQAAGPKETVGFIFIDPGGQLILTLASSCCGHVR